MDLYSDLWLVEHAMVDNFFYPELEPVSQFSQLPELQEIDAVGFAAELQHTSFSPYQPSSSTERLTKAQKTNNWSSRATTNQNSDDASPVGILSFGIQESPLELNLNFLTHPGHTKKNYEVTNAQTAKGSCLFRNKEHVFAERKRREKLNQRFIALSAMLSGLKKMDKTSVLEDAIKYVKQLQATVKSLDDRAAKRAKESEQSVTKSQFCTEESYSLACLNSCDYEAVPEIEAKICDENVLVKIHCSSCKGSLVKAICEIEKLDLSIRSTSVVPFAGSSLHITIVAQIEEEEESKVTVKDIVNNLVIALRQCK